jgi:hypothetical protein
MRKLPRTFSLRRSARVAAHPDLVMGHVLDPSTWPAWQPEILSSDGPSPLSENDVVSGRAEMLGFVGVEGRSTATKVGEAVFEEHVVVGIGMRIRYEVQPDGEGAVITHHLESDLPRGVAGRMLSFLLRRRLRSLQRTALERLVLQSERKDREASRVG